MKKTKNQKKTKQKTKQKIKNNKIDLIRFCHLYDFDKVFLKKYKIIAGMDEAGRGSLAGDVVAGVVVLDYTKEPIFVDDSKKLNKEIRKKLYLEIKSKCLDHAVGIVSAKEIDKHNILNATKKAMNLALMGLKIKPSLVLIDAVALETKWKIEPIIQGDEKSACIAAASILAKVTRDQIMDHFHMVYPEYHFNKNKGYTTKEHLRSLKEHGICDIHRKTFRPVKESMIF